MFLLNVQAYIPESAEAAVAAAVVAIRPKPQSRRWCSIVPLSFSFTDAIACFALQTSLCLFVMRPQFQQLHEQRLLLPLYLRYILTLCVYLNQLCSNMG